MNLPHHDGLLPFWLLFVAHPSAILLGTCADVRHNQVSALSIFNTVQSFLTLVFTRRVYAGGASKTNVTPLSSRLFGTWTFLSCIIRYYAAYHLDSREMYIVTFWTFGIALFHFLSEWLVYGTMQFGKGIVPSLTVATVSLVWMTLQYGFYVQ